MDRDLIVEGTDAGGMTTTEADNSPFYVFSIKAQDHVFWNLETREDAQKLADFYEGWPVATKEGTV